MKANNLKIPTYKKHKKLIRFNFKNNINRVDYSDYIANAILSEIYNGNAVCDLIHSIYTNNDQINCFGGSK